MATYISLVNELLRRLNEVTINVTDFDTVRNIQSLAKDSINSSIRELLQEAQEWPFTLVTYTQPLTIGSGSYAFPSDFSKADWDSFYLKAVEFLYWKYPQDLILADDVCIVPDRFKHVIIDGAMMYMMRFRSNEQSANIHQDKYMRGIKSMRRLIVDSPTELYSRVLSPTNRSSF